MRSVYSILIPTLCLQLSEGLNTCNVFNHDAPCKKNTFTVFVRDKRLSETTVFYWESMIPVRKCSMLSLKDSVRKFYITSLLSKMSRMQQKNQQMNIPHEILPGFR
ncbi:hypothetical protein DPMN_110506 [Dreissena polymorpha]|uniref:Secreted protein n=1 Tax=Dreissena polymorpha TaxID=45954 RepID=A0A9D4KC76_DREPO|nr:hypothetical protein DPMN_110506 [Dreissena polymorpha]